MSEVQQDNNAPPVLETSDKSFRRFGLLVLLVVFVIFGGWAALAPLESAVIANGAVEVALYKQKVQHQQGGVVAGILARDGDLVKAGDVLLRLDSVQVQAQVDALLPYYGELLAQEGRLLAERDNRRRIDYGPDFVRLPAPLRDELQAGQDQLFFARRQERASHREILEKRIVQLESQIISTRAAIDGKSRRLAYAKEEIADWQLLFEQQLTDKLKLRELQKEEAMLEGDIAASQAEISRLESAISQTRSEIILKEREFEREVATTLRDVQAKLADTKGRLIMHRDALQKTELRAPMAGVVVGMAAHTVGGVIGPGQIVLEIVPQDQQLIINAKFLSVDIDRVREGLLADITFSPYSYQTPHVVEGRVANVSAHAFVDERSGMSYYEALIEVTEPGMAQIAKAGFALVPGMPTQIMIKAGSRTMLGYLVRPLSNMLDQAFREK